MMFLRMYVTRPIQRWPLQNNGTLLSASVLSTSVLTKRFGVAVKAQGFPAKWASLWVDESPAPKSHTHHSRNKRTLAHSYKKYVHSLTFSHTRLRTHADTHTDGRTDGRAGMKKQTGTLVDGHVVASTLTSTSIEFCSTGFPSDRAPCKRQHEQEHNRTRLHDHTTKAKSSFVVAGVDFFPRVFADDVFLVICNVKHLTSIRCLRFQVCGVRSKNRPGLLHRETALVLTTSSRRRTRVSQACGSASGRHSARYRIPVAQILDRTLISFFPPALCQFIVAFSRSAQNTNLSDCVSSVCRIPCGRSFVRQPSNRTPNILGAAKTQRTTRYSPNQ